MKQWIVDRFRQAPAIWDNIIHFQWTEGLLYWMVYSAGTFSGLAFLAASIWMSINAADHEFVRMFLSEEETLQWSYWAVSAYVVLPVCILPLAAITTYKHARVWIYEKRWICSSTLWCLLYGLPTLMFLVIDICIIGNSNHAGYALPDPLVVGRSIMAYAYGLTAIIYHYVGKKQEADRLKEKDVLITELQEQSKALASRIDIINVNTRQREQALNDEIASLKTQLLTSQNQHKVLQNEVKRGTDDALQAYGEDCVNWLSSGIKTASIDDISRQTGHSKQKLVKAKLRRSPRNQDLILIESLTEWLKETPPSTPQLRIVNE